MENPMNDKETRVQFLRMGFDEFDIRKIYLMFERIKP